MIAKEGLGYYGIMLTQVGCPVEPASTKPYGRLTMAGDVENWRTGGPGDHGRCVGGRQGIHSGAYGPSTTGSSPGPPVDPGNACRGSRAAYPGLNFLDWNLDGHVDDWKIKAYSHDKQSR